MRWKSLCAAVAASFALLANEAMSEQGTLADSDRQAYAEHRKRASTAKGLYETLPRTADPGFLGNVIKQASPRDAECSELTSLGYRRIGSLTKSDGLRYDSADCRMPAVSVNKFAVYGDPHDVFVYTSGRYAGKSLVGKELREVDGEWIVFDGKRPVMDGDVPLVYTKGSPYDDPRLRIDRVEGAGEGFGNVIMYRNRFGDHIFFSMIENRTSHFSIWPNKTPLRPTYFQRMCDGRFTKVSQPIPQHCGER